MKKRALETCKTLIILLLLLSAVFLALTAAAYSGSELPLVTRFAAGLRGEIEQPPRKEENPSLSDAATPLLISVHTDAGRTSFWGASAELSGVYETLGGYLAEALDTADEPSPIASSVFLNAAAGKGVLFRFPGEIPLPVLAAWLDASCAAQASADRFLLAPQDGSVQLLFSGADGSFLMNTQAGIDALLTALQLYPDDGTRLALETEDPAFARLDPLTLIDPSVTELSAAAGKNPCDDSFLTDAASVLGFNPFGDGSYRDAAGNTVFTETDWSMRVSADGNLFLRNHALDSRFSAAGSDDGSCVEYVRTLLDALARYRIGDASLQFTGLREEDGKKIVEFSYLLAGLPVEQPSGPAVEASFSGPVLSELRFRVRRYSLSQSERIRLLPPAQAAAVLEDGAELRLAYADQADGPMSAGWLRGGVS